MALIDIESRSRIAIEWYDTEAEAQARAEQILATWTFAVEKANVGYVQCGRDPGFDRRDPKTGLKIAYAVVTP
jgi:hypothetical protein